MHALLAMFGLGPMELVVLVVVGALLFGKSLPSMGRHIAKGIVEFKKGVKGIEEEVSDAASPAPARNARVPVSAPRFDVDAAASAKA